MNIFLDLRKFLVRLLIFLTGIKLLMRTTLAIARIWART